MFKKLRDKSKNKKGFTLVELIVVIVIILILAAVLVPSLLKYIDKANKANCKADAATVLSQLQADYAASQASDQTGLTFTDGSEIAGVKVSKKAAAGANEAAFQVTAVTSADGQSFDDITFFQYNNGKYTATWNQSGTDAGWKVVKN